MIRSQISIAPVAVMAAFVLGPASASDAGAVSGTRPAGTTLIAPLAGDAHPAGSPALAAGRCAARTAAAARHALRRGRPGDHCGSAARADCKRAR